MIRTVSILVFALFLSTAVFSQERQFNFFKNQKTFIKNPFELRDPFRRPKTKMEKTIKKKSSGSTIMSNAPTLEGVELNRIRIVGILLGGTRRAVAKVASGVKKGSEGEGLSDETYILKEGMVLGNNQAEIRAILPGGVVLVEKLTNVYDQEEYLETILPLQTTN
jgi:Tfp pilus assembly protein PilP